MTSALLSGVAGRVARIDDLPRAACPLLTVGGREHQHELLRAVGFDVEHARSAADALSWLSLNASCVVLIDRQLPDASGAELCRQIRGLGSARRAYVVLRDCVDSACGADDFLPPWASPDELISRMQSARRVLLLEAAVCDESATMHRLRIIDHLTGVYNERHLQRELPREFRRAHQHQRRLALLACGLHCEGEHWDLLSTAQGAAALCKLSELLVGHIRLHIDYVARLTGGLFAVVLPETGLAGAHAIRLRIMNSLKQIARQPDSWLRGLRVGGGAAEALEQSSDEQSVCDALLAAALNDMAGNPAIGCKTQTTGSRPWPRLPQLSS